MNIWIMRGITKLLALILIATLLGCGSSRTYTPPPVSSNPTPTVTPIKTSSNGIETGTAEEGLDLRVVTEIAKTAKDAADFEKQLNQPNSVNNLDLDEDGKVDYIHVTEFKDSNNETKGFSLTVELGKGNIQEIATIMLQIGTENKQRVGVHITGNQEIYGDDDYYIAGWDFSESTFATWVFSNKRKNYSSPYRYGMYAAGFVAFATVGYYAYRSKIEKSFPNSFLTVHKTTYLSNKPTLTSPNQGKTANNIKAPLAKPNSSQQVYQAQNPTRATTTTTRNVTYPSSSSSSSRSTSPSTSSSSSRSTSSYPSYSSSSSSSSKSSSSSSSSSSRSSSSSSSSRRR